LLSTLTFSLPPVGLFDDVPLDGLRLYANLLQILERH